MSARSPLVTVRIVPLTGGTFSGPELRGTLLPGASADWQIILPDGTALGDVRYTLETERGDLLYVQSQSVRHGSTAVLERLGRGEDVDAGEYTFRGAVKIETGADSLDWLNKGTIRQCRRPAARRCDLRGLSRRMSDPSDSREPSGIPRVGVSDASRKVAIVTGASQGIGAGL